MLTQDGSVRSYNWINRAQVWEVLLGTPADTCDNYGICGPNGACNIDNSPLCGCLEGFRPNFQQKGACQGATYACMRMTPLKTAPAQLLQIWISGQEEVAAQELSMEMGKIYT